MSVGHARASVKDLGRRAVAGVTGARQWSLWESGRPFATYVLAVGAAALAVAALTATMVPVSRSHVLMFTVLVVISGVHLELNRHAERLRELATEGGTFTNFSAIWTFAGLLLLPPPLVVALIALVYIHMATRIRTRGALHAWVFTAANAILASAAAGAVLAQYGPYPGWPAGWVGIGVVILAAVVRWFVNSVLLFVYMGAMPTVRWRRAWKNVFGTPNDDLIEFASLSLGAMVAMLVALGMPGLLLLVVPLLALHRGFQARQFEVTAQSDPESGLLRPEHWRQLATKALERAERFKQPAGYLYIRLDEPDRDGNPGVDGRAVRLVADAIKSVVREGDLIGRLPGGPDFAVLVSDISHDELTHLAERIRVAVRSVDVTLAGQRINCLTVSIGGASYPNPADSLDHMMTCADNAVFMVRSYRRNRVDMVSVVAPDKRPSGRAVAEVVADS